MSLTTSELAAFLGVTPSGLRSIIRHHNARSDVRPIHPVGKRGKANTYDPREVLDKVGAHDRRYTRKRRTVMAH